jgi:hypothetical protein
MVRTRAEVEAAWRAQLQAVAAGELPRAELDCGSGSLARTLWEASQAPDGVVVEVEQERLIARRA